MQLRGVARYGRILLIWLVLAAGTAAVVSQSAGAATLGQVWQSLAGKAEESNPGHANPGAGNPGHGARCLKMVAVGAAVPARLPLDKCAAQTVGALYLGLLRDRERLRLVRNAMTRQRNLLSLVEERISAGRAPTDAFLLADIELNRWQVEEARLVASLLHVELFFRSLVETEPSEMVRPRFAPSAWPADESEALATLAQQEGIPEDQRPVLENLLQHAWIDYKAAEREVSLLRPMSAAAQDVAKAVRGRYEADAAGLAGLHDRYREATSLQLGVVSAEFQQLLAQMQVLELLGRRSAVE